MRAPGGNRRTCAEREPKTQRLESDHYRIAAGISLRWPPTVRRHSYERFRNVGQRFWRARYSASRPVTLNTPSGIDFADDLFRTAQKPARHR